MPLYIVEHDLMCYLMTLIQCHSKQQIRCYNFKEKIFFSLFNAMTDTNII